MFHSAWKWANSQLESLKNTYTKKSTTNEQTESLINSDQTEQQLETQIVSISENVIEPTNNDEPNIKVQSEKSHRTNRFDFLDGYRGSLALIVVISHSYNGIDCRILRTLAFGSQKYAVSGFFLLSSFLLTYRLLKDLYRENSNKILSILHYFIRRFFRIYVVYILFACLVIYGPRFFAGYSYGHYTHISQIMILGFPGTTHLWTIPPEIKYYFLIPVICASFYSMRRLAPLFFAACLAWNAYDQLYNALSLKSDDVVNWSQHPHDLKGHFAVFFIGSTFAMGFFLIERSEKLMNFVKQDRVQLILKIASLAVGLYGWVFHTETLNKSFDYKMRSRPAVFWAISLFMALLSSSSANHPFVDFFKLKFLMSCGKFSFGIYLLHPAAVHFIKTYEQSFIVFKFRVLSSICFSYVLGFLFYHVLEKHLIRLANNLCSRLTSFKCFQK